MPCRSISCIALVALLAVLYPSRPLEGQFRFSGGYDLTTFLGSGAEGASNRSSLGVGGSAVLLTAGPVILIAEGYYRQKGARSVAEFNQQVFEEGAAEIGLDYIEIPVLARVNLPTVRQRFVPYLNAGPAFGWKIDCGVRFQEATGAAEQSCDDLEGENLEETLRSYEQGLVVGGGLDIAVLGGVGAVNIDARMTRGLSRINETAEGGEVRNRAFSLMLGYSFGIPGGLRVP